MGREKDQSESPRSSGERPYIGIHVCELRSPAKYDTFRVSKCARRGGPKKLCIDHRYGIFKKKGKRTSELQELWFRVSDGWTASAARNYCKKQGGSFGAALKKKKEVSEMSDVVLGENELFDLLTHRAPVGTRLAVEELEGKAKTAFGKLGLDSDVYIFPLTPSTQALDSYGTRMSGGSMQHYWQDALAGVPLMDSHKTGGWLSGPAEQPMGYSFWGELSGEAVDETPLLDLLDEKSRKLSVSTVDKGLMDTGLTVGCLDYMLREHYPNGPMKMGTEDAIRSIEGKTTRHISIGFGSTLPDRLTYVCGLCGLPVLSRDCDHVPLVRDKETGLLGFAWVTNARMNEHSLVWRGATPGAIVGKARFMAGQGRIDALSLDLLESVFQVRIRPGAVSGPGVEFGREVDMTGIGKREEEVPEGEVPEVEEPEEEAPEEEVSEEAPESEEVPEEDVPEPEEAPEEAPEEEAPEEESGDKEEEAALMARLTALEESVSRVLERLEEASDEETSEEESGEEAESEEGVESEEVPEEVSEESEEEAPEGETPEEEVSDEGSQAAPDYVIGLSAEELVTELQEILGRVEAAEQRLTGEVEQDVQIAQAHRADLVEQAVRTRVRAGFKFPADRYRIRLKDMSLEELRNEIEELEGVVQRIFVPGRPLARPELLGASAPGRKSGDDMELYRVAP